MDFFIFGHKHVLSTHKNTVEFTKDSELSLKGDCILGVKADFDYGELMNIVKTFDKLKIILDNIDEINCLVNKKFDDSHEIVIRRSDFNSKRTLGIRADKAAIDIDKKIVETLKNPENKVKVKIIGYNNEKSNA